MRDGCFYITSHFKFSNFLRDFRKQNLFLILVESPSTRRSCCKIIVNYFNFELKPWPTLFALRISELIISITLIWNWTQKTNLPSSVTNCDKYITNCDGYYKLRQHSLCATFRSSQRSVLQKKVFLKNSQSSHEKPCVAVFFSKKVAGLNLK